MLVNAYPNNDSWQAMIKDLRDRHTLLIFVCLYLEYLPYLAISSNGETLKLCSNYPLY